MTPRFWLTLLAPIIVGSLLVLLRVDDTKPTPTPPIHRTPLERYRVGHDWVETPPPPTSKARDFLNGELEKDYAQCQDKNCQTCQWTLLFGGEW